MKCYFKYFEKLHFGQFLIAVQISSLHEQLNLLRSRLTILLHSHCIVQIAFDLRQAQVSIFVLIVFFEDYIDSPTQLFITAYHLDIIFKNKINNDVYKDLTSSTNQNKSIFLGDYINIFKQSMQSTFIVLIQNDKIQVKRQFADVSQYISNILFIGQGEQQIEIDSNIISKQTFQEVIRFYQINNYSDPQVSTPIRTNNLQDVVDKKNYEFIKEYSFGSEKTYQLLNAAQFLVCNGLKRIIAAVFACKLYFQDDKASYIKKKAQLGITKQVSFEDEQRYKQTHIFKQQN